MRIIDLISKDSVKLNLVSKDKLNVIDELVELVDNSGNLNDSDYEQVFSSIYNKLDTTSKVVNICENKSYEKFIKLF